MVTKKLCYVPGCRNNNIINPNKMFITVPRNLVRKKKWFDAVKRDYTSLSSSTLLYCCGDHFNLEDDMDNYHQYTLNKVCARMKSDVVPHILIERSPKKYSNTRKRKISELIAEEPEPSTSCSYSLEDFNISRGVEFQETHHITRLQTKRPKHDSMQLPLKKLKVLSFNSNTRANDRALETSDVDFWQQLSQNHSDSDSDAATTDRNEEKVQFRNMFIKLLEKKLEIYTGIPKNYHNLIDVLHKRSYLEKHFIYLTLLKIKSNDSFAKLADLFGLSRTHSWEIFQNSCRVLADFLKQLLFWSSKTSVKQNLPLVFRSNFSNVRCIIACLEIQIEKPREVDNQALTWSEYNKCNTIKYLISSTPDGLINFVSAGYGGCATDLAIFDDCGYLDVLPESTVVMVDTGFEQVEGSLRRKNCTLVRLPSAEKKKKMTKDDVRLTKTIANVRIHIERIIERFRNFEMLSSHAILKLDLIEKLDCVMVIVCAIINLHGPIN